MERQLFFATAKTHLDAGCPLLALDVLSSLPPVKLMTKKDPDQIKTQPDKIPEGKPDKFFIKFFF